MGQMEHIVVVSESTFAPELWNARRARVSGWLEQLRGLAEAGNGKALKLGPLTESQLTSRKNCIFNVAKKAGMKVEFALDGAFLGVRIVSAPPAREKAGSARSDGQVDRRSLPELVLQSLGNMRWRTTAQVGFVVLAMDARAAKEVTASMVGDALNDLYKAKKILRREEEGIVTWRGPAKA